MLKPASRLPREWSNKMSERNPHAVEAQGLGVAYEQRPYRPSSEQPQELPAFPSGLLGDVARFIYEQAPYPNASIALAGAIGFLAGVVGREYNVSGLGLNQYILVLSPTGTGKEAIAGGISKLFASLSATVPSIIDRNGPGYIQSAPGLIKALAKSPCFVSVIGEVGLRLAAMASPKASPNDKLTMAVLLDCYAKSGQGHILGAMAYSDKEKNIPAIDSPALTVVGEGVPESFYAAVDETHIASGLLPRFLAFENNKPRPYLNRKPGELPQPGHGASLGRFGGFLPSRCQRQTLGRDRRL